MNREPERDALRPEYDFTAGAKGRHRRAYRQGTNAVLLEPDVAAVFKDAAAVNTALRALVQVAAAQAVANVDLFQRTDRRTDEPEPTAHLYCRTPSKGDCRLPPDEGAWEVPAAESNHIVGLWRTPNAPNSKDVLSLGTRGFRPRSQREIAWTELQDSNRLASLVRTVPTLLLPLRNS